MEISIRAFWSKIMRNMAAMPVQERSSQGALPILSQRKIKLVIAGGFRAQIEDLKQQFAEFREQFE